MNNLEKLTADIADQGTRHVFGITGGGLSLTLLDALEKHRIEPVRTYFEGSAVLMAATVGRLSGHAGIAYGIKGPGLANMVPGMAAASLDASPLVAIVEAYPPGTGAEKAHKRFDHGLLTAAVCKGVRALSDGGPDFIAMAAWAEAEVPGPVVFELAGPHVPRQPPLSLLPLSQGGDEELLRLLEQAQRPAIIVGSLAIRQGWQSELAPLRIPVFSTAAAKGVLDERAIHAAGVYTGVGLELTPEATILSKADLVIGLGLRPNEVLATKAFHCPAINFDPATIAGSEAFHFRATASTPSPLFWKMLGIKSWGLDELNAVLQKLDQIILQEFLPGAAFRTLQDILGSKLRMVIDTGYFCTIGEHVWKAPSADLCLLSGQGRYMGTSVPMAIGAAIHDPCVPVVAVAGDGGIAMYLAEIRIAVERRLPVLFVLMSDGCFGSIAPRAIKDGLSRTAIDIKTPSWHKVMECLGLRSWSVDNPQSLRDALEAWTVNRIPGYLEISFPQEPYRKICQGIRA